MRKLLVLALALALVFSMSGFGIASDSDSQPFSVKVNPYMTVAFNTPVEWAGLFGNGQDINLGKPAIYISNGLEATAGKVEEIWEDVLLASPGDYMYTPTEISFAPGVEGAELFSVDANCLVDVTLSADWDTSGTWVDAPSLLLVHSDSSWNGGTYLSSFNGIMTWYDFLAYIGNQVSDPANTAYQDMIDEHNSIGTTNDTFTLDFVNDYKCKGPIDFTIDGALLIPKVSQAPAGTYEAEVTITVAAAGS